MPEPDYKQYIGKTFDGPEGECTITGLEPSHLFEKKWVPCFRTAYKGHPRTEWFEGCEAFLKANKVKGVK